jgi:hypothetical protein
MNRILSSGAVALALFAMTSGYAQTPANKDEQDLLTLIEDVKGQQAQIAENEGKIDAKMAEVNEAVRLARIFAGRGGK